MRSLTHRFLSFRTPLRRPTVSTAAEHSELPATMLAAQDDLENGAATPIPPTQTQTQTQTQGGASMLQPRVDIPIVSPGAERDARRVLRDRGRHLARQDRWDLLCAEITAADHKRSTTPGLVSTAVLLAEGARSDMVQAARDGIALNDPKAVQTAAAALEETREERPDCPAFAYILAMTHIDVATLWRGTAELEALVPARRTWHDHHLTTAAAMVDLYDPFERDSALWAAVRCSVLEADDAPASRVADDYEDLIDLAPCMPEHLSALGRDLRPRRFGTWETLDVQARRTAERTTDVWGMGAYSWIWLGALQHHSGPVQRFDGDLFAAGLHDILDRHDDQHMVNRLAAFTGLALAPLRCVSDGRVTAGQAFGWIAQNHLREIHPLVWAETVLPGQPCPDGVDESTLIGRGTARAYSTLAEQFSQQMGLSGHLVVGTDGLRVA